MWAEFANLGWLVLGKPAPLPCTPYPNEQLKLRDPNDLGKGFRIDPTVPVPEPVPESPPSAG